MATIKFYTLLALVAIVAGGSEQEYADLQTASEKLFTMLQECMEETFGNNPDYTLADAVSDAFYDGKEDPNFMICFAVKLGYMDKEGNFNTEKIKETYSRYGFDMPNVIDTCVNGCEETHLMKRAQYILECVEKGAETAPRIDGDDLPAEGTPAEVAQGTEETNAEAAPAEATAAEEAPTEEAPAKEPPAEEAPTEEAPAEDAPAEEAPAEDAPAEEVPAEEAPAEEVPAEAAPADETPAEEAPAEEAVPDNETPAEEAPAEPSTKAIKARAGTPATGIKYLIK